MADIWPGSGLLIYALINLEQKEKEIRNFVWFKWSRGCPCVETSELDSSGSLVEMVVWFLLSQGSVVVMFKCQ